MFACALWVIHMDARRPPPKRPPAANAVETGRLQILALVPARTDGRLGKSLVRSSIADCGPIIAVAIHASLAGPPALPSLNRVPPCGIVAEPGVFAMDSSAIGRLCYFLSTQFGTRVVDRTGLSGLFNVTLLWTPSPLPVGPPLPDLPSIDPDGPPIHAAIQEQLGLRLQLTTTALSSGN